MLCMSADIPGKAGAQMSEVLKNWIHSVVVYTGIFLNAWQDRAVAKDNISQSAQGQLICIGSVEPAWSIMAAALPRQTDEKRAREEV